MSPQPPPLTEQVLFAAYVEYVRHRDPTASLEVLKARYHQWTKDQQKKAYTRGYTRGLKDPGSDRNQATARAYQAGYKQGHTVAREAKARP